MPLFDLQSATRSPHPASDAVLDEAQMFCPEGSDADSADAVTSLATRGRKRGFCLVAATQRLSSLSKNVAAQLSNKLIGRIVSRTNWKSARSRQDSKCFIVATIHHVFGLITYFLVLKKTTFGIAEVKDAGNTRRVISQAREILTLFSATDVSRQCWLNLLPVVGL